MSEDQISVLIADDNEGVRQAYSFYLSSLPSVAMVLEADSGERAVSLVHDCLPDVVLMDVCIANMNGIEATRCLRKRCPAVRIVGWTGLMKDAPVRDMLSAGAHGFIMKADSLAETEKAIFNSLEQDCYLSPNARRLLFSKDAPRNNRQDSRLTLLSSRERQVVSLRAKGMLPGQIVHELGISESTVKSHLGSAMSKWRVRSCVDVVRIYLEETLS